MDQRQWEEVLEHSPGKTPTPIQAVTFLRAWATASKPVLLLCDDGREYVVKGRQAGRMVFNDHVVALLGCQAAAPVGQAAVINVPKELIDLQPEMAHMEPGDAHGTLWIPDCTEREGIQYTHVPENRPRFASLALLYGWVGANDHQFIYSTASPHLVHSVDHGHFFPGGPEWTIASLQAAPDPAPDASLQSACNCTNEELVAAAAKLLIIADADIANVVAVPPVGWGSVSLSERAALAQYLSGRRDHLVASLANSKGSEDA